jgi:hypothetical protein
VGDPATSTMEPSEGRPHLARGNPNTFVDSGRCRLGCSAYPHRRTASWRHRGHTAGTAWNPRPARAGRLPYDAGFGASRSVRVRASDSAPTARPGPGVNNVPTTS